MCRNASVLLVFFSVLSFVFIGCGTDPKEDASSGGASNRTLEACLSGESGLPDSICPTKDPFLNLLAIDKANDCKAQNLVYDRNNNVCTQAKLNTFDCTYNGVKAAFASTITQIDAQLEQSVGSPTNADDNGDGYLFDQCGAFDNGDPIVFLVKLENSDPPKVLVRKLSTGEPVTTTTQGSNTSSESDTTNSSESAANSESTSN